MHILLMQKMNLFHDEIIPYVMSLKLVVEINQLMVGSISSLKSKRNNL